MAQSPVGRSAVEKHIGSSNRILIVLLLVVSLLPTIVRHGSIVRYGIAGGVLFIAAVTALLLLRDADHQTHLMSFLLTNRLFVAALVLYGVAISVAARAGGALPDNVHALGGFFIIITILLFLPVAVREKGQFIFLVQALFIVGVVNATVAFLLLVLKWACGSSLGIFPVWQFSNNKLALMQKTGIPYVMKGLFWHPNFLGILSAFTLPSGLFLAQQAPSRSTKWLYRAGLVLLLFSLAGAFAFISMVAACIGLVLFRVSTKKTIVTLTRMFIVISVLTMNIVILAGGDLTFLNSLPITSPGRVERWNKAIMIIHEHPFWGVGASNSSAFLPGGLSAHNTFVDIALGSGIPAVIIYSAFLLNVADKICRPGKDSLSAYMVTSFLCFFFLQFFETQLPGGMSVANFYFLMLTTAYVSISSSGMMQMKSLADTPDDQPQFRETMQNE
ncbi:MAG: O-antigen ligase family protein [Thermodesulfovibrionales bacterium]